MSGWRTRKRIALEKNKDSILKERAEIPTNRAEFLLKFAFMSDEQFEKWCKLETRAEVEAFMGALPMPHLKNNQVSIRLEKEKY